MTLAIQPDAVRRQSHRKPGWPPAVLGALGWLLFTAVGVTWLLSMAVSLGVTSG